MHLLRLPTLCPDGKGASVEYGVEYPIVNVQSITIGGAAPLRWNSSVGEVRASLLWPNAQWFELRLHYAQRCNPSSSGEELKHALRRT